MAGELLAKPRIQVDGQDLAPPIDVRLEQTIVDDHVQLPDMFALRFRDPSREILRQAKITIGSKVSVLAGAEGEEPTHLLISGEVTSLEGEFATAGSHVVVRGYDLSHR